MTEKTSTSSRILRVQTRPRGYKTFFMLNSVEHEFFLLKNVKMPTIVGILIFMSRKNNIYAYLSLKKAELFDIFILMSIINFMLS